MPPLDGAPAPANSSSAASAVCEEQQTKVLYSYVCRTGEQVLYSYVLISIYIKFGMYLCLIRSSLGPILFCDEGTGYCHIFTKKTAPYRPTAGHRGLGSSRVAQIVAFLQDCCDRKKYLPEVVMLRTTPEKAGAVSHGPIDRGGPRDRPELHAGAACRSFFLRICLYFVRLLSCLAVE
jgi:hypothetical protein